MVRTDQTERQGYGTVASVSIVAIDNISGKRLIEADTLLLTLSDVRAIGLDQEDRVVGTQGSQAIVWDTELGNPDSPFANAPQFCAWPNPAKDLLYIDWKGSQSVKICILDQMGRVVLQNPPTTQNQVLIPTDHLATGLYFLNLNFDGQQATKRLLIQR